MVHIQRKKAFMSIQNTLHTKNFIKFNSVEMLLKLNFKYEKLTENGIVEMSFILNKFFLMTSVCVEISSFMIV